jgi:hypothetical protein
MRVYCGIDLGETAHQACLVDRQGRILGQARLLNDPSGVRELTGMLRAFSVRRADVRIAVEDPHSLFVLALDTARFPVFPINPLAASRYRRAHRTAGAKSDRTDAFDLAEMLRVEFGRLSPLFHDSPQLLALRTLSRAHETQRRIRFELHNRLRTTVLTFYPAARTTFKELDGLDARTALQLMPTPSAARSVRARILEQALRDAGRQKSVDVRAQRILQGLREPALRQPAPLVEQVKGTQVLLLLAQLNQCVAAEEELLALLLAHYAKHPLHEIMTSFPGLSGMLGARLLAELGDDPNRFTNVRALRARGGTCPITRRTGTSLLVVTRRLAYNRRLGNTLNLWSLSLRVGSPAAQAGYERRRALGDRHNSAVRRLMNRYVGILAHCLRTREPYDEAKVVIHAAPNDGDR